MWRTLWQHKISCNTFVGVERVRTVSDRRADQVVVHGLEPLSGFYARERVAMVTLANATSGSRLAVLVATADCPYVAKPPCVVGASIRAPRSEQIQAVSAVDSRRGFSIDVCNGFTVNRLGGKHGRPYATVCRQGG